MSDIQSSDSLPEDKGDPESYLTPIPDGIGMDDVKLSWSLLWTSPGVCIKGFFQALLYGLLP